MEKQHSLLIGSTTDNSHHKTHQKGLNTLSIYVDGAARGNPGPAGAGIHIFYNTTDILKKGIYLGEKTNNQAEYLALALALFFVEKLCTEHHIINSFLSIHSDSELLIKQMRGEYKIKNEILARLKSIIDSQLTNHTCRFTHVVREKNKEADKLANIGIDKKNKIPVAFMKTLSENGLLI